MIKFIFIVLLSVSLVSAIDISTSDVVGVNIIPEVPAAGGGGDANVSQFWNTTNQGLISSTAEIEHNLLANLLWSVAGHIMDTILDMNWYNIDDVQNITAVQYLVANDTTSGTCANGTDTFFGYIGGGIC